MNNMKTPLAVEDFMLVEEIFSKSEFRNIGITSFDLIKNDLGGNAKSFLGLGDFGGNSLEIDGVGEIIYDYEADMFSFKPADGFEGGTVEFEYAIQLGNGVISSATASFDATVKNKQEILCDFNGLTSGFRIVGVENGYKGFNWDGIAAIDYDFANVSPPVSRFGYKLLTAPGEDDAAFGKAGTISHAEGLDFDFITGTFSTTLGGGDIIIKAFDDGEQVGRVDLGIPSASTVDVNFLEQTSDVNSFGNNYFPPDFLAAEFTGTFESIDFLEISSPNQQFAMDDLLLAIEI